jgi:hypothetical protein
MWLHGWLCSVIAEFMVMHRWVNTVLHEFLNWSLKMVLVIRCYQTSMLLLLLGRHVYKNVEWQRKERGVKKQPGCMWIEVNNEVCTLVVDDQDHPQMIEIRTQLQRLSGIMHNVGYVPSTQFVWHDVEEEEEEERHFIWVTIVRDWLLHRGSPTQFLV